uniref:6-phosphofructokinase n=1 Tax=Romanomermis culicivorax TaxID=13658 RepID=A0A915I601_ROMCU
MAGGSRIGARKEMPEDWEKVAKMLERFKIHSLVLIGGFQAYRAALTMLDLRLKHKSFCIPICVLPATISNNVPGSSFSVGSDTALNEICATIEKIKQSATGTRRRVFIVEVMGGYCGYLATLAALASGADNAYIFEEKFSLDNIREDVRVIAEKMLTGNQRYLITRCEKANENYTADFITKLFTEEGAGLFETKSNTLGHHQQGGTPSPFDRIHGIKLAVRAIEWLVPICNASMTGDDVVYTTKPDTVCVIGLLQRQIAFTPVADL